MIGDRYLGVGRTFNRYRSAIEAPSFQSISTNTFYTANEAEKPEKVGSD